MEWRATLTAIKVSSDPADMLVHVVDCYEVESYLQPLTAQNHSDKIQRLYTLNRVNTYCGREVDLSHLDVQCEREKTDVNCNQCVAEVERQQAHWREFWKSPDGVEVIKILRGYSRFERERADSNRRFEAFMRSMTEYTDLLTDCLNHKEPIFTLELPDEILLMFTEHSYNTVGEVLFSFKVDAETRQNLEAKLGKVGFNLLGSRLISKGYLKANDPIFQNWK